MFHFRSKYGSNSFLYGLVFQFEEDNFFVSSLYRRSPMAAIPSGSEPHFFKVITSPSDQGLKIPDTFMRKYDRDLLDFVLLRVSTGASWRVELVHNENRGTLLQKGWEKFAEYYSIEKFYFLVFKYEGNSQFHVFIFGPTALEIEYPVQTNWDRSDNRIPKPDQRGRSSAQTGTEISNDDNEFEKISATVLEKNYLTTRASKGKRAREEEDVSIEILDEPSKCNPKSRSSPKVTVTVNQRQSRNNRGNEEAVRNRNGKSVTDKEKFKSYQRAKAFTSPNPFFISFMQPTYVVGKPTLEIPAKFWRTYFSMKHECYLLKLGVSGKKMMSWPVTVSPRSRTCLGGRITTGWKEFVQDNGLKVGDVCVFELIPGTKNFNITIFDQLKSEFSPS